MPLRYHTSIPETCTPRFPLILYLKSRDELLRCDMNVKEGPAATFVLFANLRSRHLDFTLAGRARRKNGRVTLAPPSNINTAEYDSHLPSH